MEVSSPKKTFVGWNLWGAPEKFGPQKFFQRKISPKHIFFGLHSCEGKNLGTQENFGGAKSLKFVEGEKMQSYIRTWSCWYPKRCWNSGKVWANDIVVWLSGCWFESCEWCYFFAINSGHSTHKFGKTIPILVFLSLLTVRNYLVILIIIFFLKLFPKNFYSSPHKRIPQSGHFSLDTQGKKSLGKPIKFFYFPQEKNLSPCINFYWNISHSGTMGNHWQSPWYWLL